MSPTEPIEIERIRQAYLTDVRPVPEGRPWVALDMITSIDGATTVEGRSGGLGGEADHAAFFALRAAADVVLVGAGTVRAEGYGPPVLDEHLRAARIEAARSPLPRIAIVTASLNVDLGSRLFLDSPTLPIVLTSETADLARRAAAEAVAEVAAFGSDEVVLERALRWLHDRAGARVVVCEGGPSLNAQLVEADLVDEICLTVAPALVGGTSARLARHAELHDIAPFHLARVLQVGDELLLRYVRER